MYYALAFIGAGSILIGIIMVVLRHPIAIAFCRLGKFVFFIFRPIKPINALVNFVYDEKKGPSRFSLLGLVFVAQGAFLLLLLVFFSTRS